jgi:hypothetical protein
MQGFVIRDLANLAQVVVTHDLNSLSKLWVVPISVHFPFFYLIQAP